MCLVTLGLPSSESWEALCIACHYPHQSSVWTLNNFTILWLCKILFIMRCLSQYGWTIMTCLPKIKPLVPCIFFSINQHDGALFSNLHLHWPNLLSQFIETQLFHVSWYSLGCCISMLCTMYSQSVVNSLERHGQLLGERQDKCLLRTTEDSLS